MTNRLSTEEILALSLKYLGKKVEVKDTKGLSWKGTCDFIGYNPFIPEWGLQVTVERMPLTNIDIKDIKLI